MWLMLTPRQLKMLYEQGKNISEILREELEVDHNTDEIIEISYDLQTGSYTDAQKDGDVALRKRNYCAEIVKTIQSLCRPKTPPILWKDFHKRSGLILQLFLKLIFELVAGSVCTKMD
ncbi:MAG: hypothetical protein P8Z42_04100 [Anaerolineales bacterium]